MLITLLLALRKGWVDQSWQGKVSADTKPNRCSNWDTTSQKVCSDSSFFSQICPPRVWGRDVGTLGNWFAENLTPCVLC